MGWNWNDEAVATLKRLWTEGMSATQIAGRLKILHPQGEDIELTRSAIIGKVHRLKLSGRAPSSQTRTYHARPRKKRAPGAPVLPTILTKRESPLDEYMQRPKQPVQLTIPEPKPLRLVALPKDGRVTVLHLSDSTCKWPLGDPGTDEFCFCGHGPREGSPYCEYHARIAYQPLQDRVHRKLVAR